MSESLGLASADRITSGTDASRTGRRISPGVPRTTGDVEGCSRRGTWRISRAGVSGHDPLEDGNDGDFLTTFGI